MVDRAARLEREKTMAAAAGAALVTDGMLLGLGSGSTVSLLISAIGRRVREERLDLRVVPASARSREEALSAGLRVVEIPSDRPLDLALDGADEIGPGLDLIKGGGGALLRERIVAAAADRFVVIADSSKRVPRLGGFPLPVEVYRFGMGLASRWLTGLGIPHDLRRDPRRGGEPFVTDEGNLILDCHCAAIPDARRLAMDIEACRAVAAHGIFLGMASSAIIAEGDRLARLTPDHRTG